MTINEDKTLILAWSLKSNSFEDVTSKITSFERIYPLITLKFVSGKSYQYSDSKVKIYTNPKIIPVAYPVYNTNRILIRNVKKILLFGDLYKLFLSNGNTLILDQLKPVRNNVQKDVIGYYKELVEQLASQSDIDSVDSILQRAYGKISDIEVNSVFSQYYLNKPNQHVLETRGLIFPFPFNLSQKKAVMNALTNSISLVQGPPGTGKTQMILNLIANLIQKNQSVLIVSNNNEAIKNIVEKLAKENLGEIAALLGKKENKNYFFEQINKTQDSNPQTLLPVEMSFLEKVGQLDSFYELENDRANLITQRSHIQLEYEHYCLQYPFVDNERFKKSINQNMSSIGYLMAKNSIKKYYVNGSIYQFFFRIRFKFKPIKLEDSIEPFEKYLQHLYYIKLVKEINKRIVEIDKKLSSQSFETMKEFVTNQSYRYFKNIILKRKVETQVFEFTEDNFKIKFRDFIKSYPVILSTSFSVLGSLPESEMMDYLIVDEASQSDLLSTTLALIRAKHIVVVGDNQQLPAISNPKITNLSQELSKKYQIEPAFQYHGNNLLQATKVLFPEVSTVILKEHYRCQPSIIGFSNIRYYQDALVVKTNQENDHALQVIKTVPGLHARKNPTGSGMYNLREIDEIKSFLTNNDNLGTVGIIAPFRIQVEEIRKALKGFENIEIDTVHRFQGKERDTIILSTVVNGINEEKPNAIDNFIDDYHLLNVAITRAKRKLVLIVSEGVYQTQNSELANLVNYVRYHFPAESIKEGKVVSIFDRLYQDEKNINLKKDEYLSEKVTANLLDTILKDYPDYQFAMHVPLKSFLKFSGFEGKELSYLSHPWTHVDFAIYSKTTKEIKYIIEVDGVKYHEKNHKQKDRDKLKDHCLTQNNVQLLRLKTNQSSEIERIKSFIK